MTRPDRVEFHDDTIREMAHWAARRYKLGKVDIFFRNGWCGMGFVRGSGAAHFHRGHALIELNACRTQATLTQVLAHELAHCVTIKRYGYHGHGPKFVKTANELIRAWNSYATMKSDLEID